MPADKVLVTGHEGYIGSELVELLRGDGYDVVGFDSGYFADCLFGPAPDPVPVLGKDLRDLKPADLEGFSAVIHLAGLSNDPIGNLNADWTRTINHEATVALAEAAKAAGVGRFLFSSSCIMYGVSEVRVVDETAPLAPQTEYARSKVASEEALRDMAAPGFSPVYLRNGTIYGASARLRLDTVLNNLSAAACATGKISIWGDGKPWRPVSHLDDVCRYFKLMLEAPVDAIHNQAFNCGAEHLNHRIIELAEFVAEAMPECEIEVLNRGDVDQRTYKADFTKFATTFPDFEFKWDARRGARDLCERFTRAGMDAAMLDGDRYVRLKRLRTLLEAGKLRERDLRWA